jgi:hypothetical protein
MARLMHQEKRLLYDISSVRLTKPTPAHRCTNARGMAAKEFVKRLCVTRNVSLQ